MTTNQDGPNTAAGAAELFPDNTYTPYGRRSVKNLSDLLGISGEKPTVVSVINKAYDEIAFLRTLCKHVIENPSQHPSVVPDEVVEEILFNVEQVCGPLNTEPCVILGDDDRSVLASVIRAALIAERDRLAARCERLEEALLTIKHEAERENGRWVHLKRCIAVQTKAALKEPNQ